MDFSAQLRAGPQAGKRADQRALTHRNAQLFTINVGERVNHGVGGNRAVGYDAVSAYSHAVTQTHSPFKNAIYVNLNILATSQTTPHVKTSRVSQAHALLHQRHSAAALVNALQLGQLHRAVHARYLGCI